MSRFFSLYFAINLFFIVNLIKDSNQFNLPGQILQKTENLINLPKLLTKRTNNEICFANLSCHKKLFYNENRLSSGYFIPEDPSKLNIKIIHFSQLNHIGEILRYNSSIIKNFKKNTPIIFIIHGYFGSFKNRSSNWMNQLKDVVLRVNKESANVFVVDWSHEADTIFYPEAASNTRSVGDALTFFIINLLIKNYKINCNQIHIIGHSLGSQAAGFVGEYSRKNNCHIHQITGLDPAGFYFRNDSTDSRLDKTDANYVEALHTNSAARLFEGLGTTLQSGIVDLYPNGGSNQPGCQPNEQIGDIIDNGLKGLFDLISCSHSRAHELYTFDYKLLTNCEPVAYQCKSYDAFKKGECADCNFDGSKCRILGYFPEYKNFELPKPKTNENFYLLTSESEPYCLFSYQLKITLSSKSSKNFQGNLKLDLIGENNTIYYENLFDLKIDTFQTKLLTNNYTLGQIKEIQLYYTNSLFSSIVDSLRNVKFYIETIEINYLSSYNLTIRKKLSSKLCASEAISNSEKNKSVFKKCEN